VLVGFENHGGRTELGPGVEPMGRVLAGNGNNGRDSTEGARWRNVFGTYLHGPLLPRNPAFADYLLRLALQRRYGEAEMRPTPQPDLEEASAFRVAEARARAR
jgi:CobQ-like glutamine amidotransferase family enzyme